MSQPTYKDMKEADAETCELCRLSPIEGNCRKKRTPPLLVDGQE